MRNHAGPIADLPRLRRAAVFACFTAVSLLPDTPTRAETIATAAKPAPTFADLSYGPHERNDMNIWLAESDEPTPMLIAIHGGGFYPHASADDPPILLTFDRPMDLPATTISISIHQPPLRTLPQKQIRPHGCALHPHCSPPPTRGRGHRHQT